MAVYEPGPLKLHTRDLSRRELQVVGLLAGGMSQKQAADHLGINERTINEYLRRARKKTKTKSSIAAVVYAITHKLVAIQFTDPPAV